MSAAVSAEIKKYIYIYIYMYIYIYIWVYLSSEWVVRKTKIDNEKTKNIRRVGRGVPFRGATPFSRLGRCSGHAILRPPSMKGQSALLVHGGLSLFPFTPFDYHPHQDP